MWVSSTLGSSVPSEGFEGIWRPRPILRYVSEDCVILDGDALF